MRERESKRSAPEEDRGYRERNGRRGEERDSERDSRHMTRTAGDELIHGSRDRDRERLGRRDIRDRDPVRDQQEPGDKGRGVETGRGGRSRELKTGDERRDSRLARGEDGRKRHGEDGGIDPRKRARRG